MKPRSWAVSGFWIFSIRPLPGRRRALQGKSKAALDDFLSIYLATRMLEQHPAIKPLIDLLAGQDGREAVVNGATELTVTARLPWATAHDTLDKLLPAAAAK